MNALVIIGLVTVGALALASASPSKQQRKRPDEFIRGFPNYEAFKQAAESGDTEKAENLWHEAHTEFLRRRKLLPPDAKGSIDQYSKERFSFVKGGFGVGGWPASGWTDEFGREAAGLPSNFGTTFLTVSQTVLPLVPGIGPPAAAGLAFTIAIGQGKSVKDAALSAARAAIPIQYQFAFDLGVGVASGQGIDEAAKKALFNRVPGSQQVYEQGKQLAKGLKS